jgi:dienelactone hydrolase
MNRAELFALLALPSRPDAPPALASAEMSEHDGFVVERLTLDLGDTMPVRGLLTRPVTDDKPMPAVLYCHAHGAKYDIGAAELLEGRPSLLNPYGPVLARAGFVTLCLDMPTFGSRQKPGEDALAKALLWKGKTLMGRMLGDLLAGFDYLCARPDVDGDRVAAIGLSMGATHAYFLGALEPRLARIAHLCCYADWSSLVASGAHDLHGHYMTIPGLLAKTSTGAIAGMAAPRPQLVCVGLKDPLTPPDAIDRAFEETEVAYQRAGVADALTIIREPDTGHVETPRMREAVMAFLAAMRQ